jgi:hypothetical protein
MSSREMLEFVSQYELRISASSDDKSMRFDPRSAKRRISCSVLMVNTKESLPRKFSYVCLLVSYTVVRGNCVSNAVESQSIFIICLGSTRHTKL